MKSFEVRKLFRKLFCEKKRFVQFFKENDSEKKNFEKKKHLAPKNEISFNNLLKTQK